MYGLEPVQPLPNEVADHPTAGACAGMSQNADSSGPMQHGKSISSRKERLRYERRSVILQIPGKRLIIGVNESPADEGLRYMGTTNDTVLCVRKYVFDSQGHPMLVQEMNDLFRSLRPTASERIQMVD
jgi:hypothetical protein